MTRRLFHEDVSLRDFRARVVKRETRGGRPAIVLDQTAFYPTSGGQPHDTGTLSGVRVVDVVEEGEQIFHVLDRELSADEVTGAVDWDRRMDHLQQHHGQHLLSEAFCRIAGADTRSFHLGPETCTIDLERPDVTPGQGAEAERLANDVILDDREVAIYHVTKDEIPRLPLRKPPQVDGRIRIVHVKDFDCSPCCGTHPKRTGEVGPILTLGLERRGDGTLVTFLCGRRAMAWARRDAALIKSMGSKLSASRSDLEKSVDRVLEERTALFRSLQAAEKELAVHRARAMADAAQTTARGRLVAHVIEGSRLKDLQALANQIVSRPGYVVLLGGTGDTSSMVLARSADVDLDLRSAAAEAFRILEGRGGGTPAFQQGGGKGRDLEGALRAARTALGIP